MRRAKVGQCGQADERRKWMERGIGQREIEREGEAKEGAGRERAREERGERAGRGWG